MDTYPHLRLVGTPSPHAPNPRDAPHEEWSYAGERTARDAVAGENRAAAGNTGLDPTDPRWALAVRAYSQLQGTALTFESRQRVMRTARRLGVRPFDANLIIAVVQDHARRGRELSDAAGTLALLERPGRRNRHPWARWIAAVACALVANWFLIWWLTGR